MQVLYLIEEKIRYRVKINLDFHGTCKPQNYF